MTQAQGKALAEEIKAVFIETSAKENQVMPSPSASSKFGSNILKFFKHAHFLMYTQNLDFST